MNPTPETSVNLGSVAKVGHLPNGNGSSRKAADSDFSEKTACRECAKGAGFERAAEAFHWLRCLATFGTPLELWSLVARLVVARLRVGAPVLRIDERWALVVSQQAAGGAERVALAGGCSLTVPAGCALVVESVTAEGHTTHYPLALVEPYAWSIGEGAPWGSVETVAVRLTREVLPALQAAVLTAEAGWL